MRERARRIVAAGSWPTDIGEVDREAVESLARGDGLEPYYTLKIIVHEIEHGTYKPRSLRDAISIAESWAGEKEVTR